jgi:NDP-sugar pyrophosphorylase family protein
MSSLLVLAAGMGSRYGGLKQLDQMGPNGETVLDFSVFDAIRAGFKRVIFVIREDFYEAFRDGVGARFADRIKVEYAFQKLNDLPQPFVPPVNRVKPWGTSHAILAARHLLDSPFAVINADDFYGYDAYAKAAAQLAQLTTKQCAMVAYPLINTLSEHGQVNRGICEVDERGFLSSVEEVVRIGREEVGKVSGEWLDGMRREVALTSLVSMNFWVFPAGFMQKLEAEFVKFLEERMGETGESYIPSVVDSLIQQGEICCQVLQTEASWFGVTYPEDKAQVVKAIQAMIDRGAYPSPLVAES